MPFLSMLLKNPTYCSFGVSKIIKIICQNMSNEAQENSCKRKRSSSFFASLRKFRLMAFLHPHPPKPYVRPKYSAITRFCDIFFPLIHKYGILGNVVPTLNLFSYHSVPECDIFNFAASWTEVTLEIPSYIFSSYSTPA